MVIQHNIFLWNMFYGFLKALFIPLLLQHTFFFVLVAWTQLHKSSASVWSSLWNVLLSLCVCVEDSNICFAASKLSYCTLILPGVFFQKAIAITCAPYWRFYICQKFLSNCNFYLFIYFPDAWSKVFGKYRTECWMWVFVSWISTGPGGASLHYYLNTKKQCVRTYLRLTL